MANAEYWLCVEWMHRLAQLDDHLYELARQYNEVEREYQRIVRIRDAVKAGTLATLEEVDLALRPEVAEKVWARPGFSMLTRVMLTEQFEKEKGGGGD